MFKNLKILVNRKIGKNIENAYNFAFSNQQIEHLLNCHTKLNGNELTFIFKGVIIAKATVTSNGYKLDDWSTINPNLKPMETKEYNFNNLNSCKDFTMPIISEFFNNPYLLSNDNNFYKLFKYIRSNPKVTTLSSFYQHLIPVFHDLKTFLNFAQICDLFLLSNGCAIYSESNRPDDVYCYEAITKTNIIFKVPKSVNNTNEENNISSTFVPYKIALNIPSTWQFVSLLDALDYTTKEDQAFDQTYLKNWQACNGIKIDTDLDLEFNPTPRKAANEIYFYFETKKDQNGNCLWKPYVSYKHNFSVDRINTEINNIINNMPVDNKPFLKALFIDRTPDEIVQISNLSTDTNYVTMPWTKTSFKLADLQALLTGNISVLSNIISRFINQIVNESQFNKIVGSWVANKDFSTNTDLQKFINTHPLIAKIRQFDLSWLNETLDNSDTNIITPQPSNNINKSRL